MFAERTTDHATNHIPTVPSVEAIALVRPDIETDVALVLQPEALDMRTSTVTNTEADLSCSTLQLLPSAIVNSRMDQLSQLEPRIRVRWHAEAFIEGKGVYKGFLKGISAKGTDIFLDLNLQKVESVKLRIHMPPHGSVPIQRVMEVTAKVIYSAYDGNEFLFHSGLNFTRFSLASDHVYLQSRIAAFKS